MECVCSGCTLQATAGGAGGGGGGCCSSGGGGGGCCCYATELFILCSITIIVSITYPRIIYAISIEG